MARGATRAGCGAASPSSPEGLPRATRAAAPVLGVVLLTAVAVVMAAGIAAAVGGVSGEAPATASIGFEADASTAELRFTHRGGTAIAPSSLRLRVSIDGEPLDHQPSVPFFAARGFESGPTGPFNSATSGDWTAGETATLAIAGTNQPTLAPGVEVTVRLYSDGHPIAILTDRA